MSDTDAEWLTQYAQGARFVRLARSMGWAVGKGEVRRAMRRPSSWNGFGDALMDSMN